jgi:hypothetical protein
MFHFLFLKESASLLLLSFVLLSGQLNIPAALSLGEKALL